MGGQKGFQGQVPFLGYFGRLDAQIGAEGDLVLRQGQQIAGLSVLVEEQGVVPGQVGDPAVAQPKQVVRGFPARQYVVIVHIDGLVDVPVGFSDEHV